MNDTSFFDTVLPSQGLRCIALPQKDGDGTLQYWRHKWGPDNAWLVTHSVRLDTAQNADVYYACASYLPGPHDVATGRNHRKQQYAYLVRSLWVDLDCGPGKPYATQKDGVRAIFAFAKWVGLPPPLIVDSGNGLHTYWPMTRDLTVAEWKPLAEALKRALTAFGVHYDPSRTADAASVLRPPGTHHRKGAPKLVRVMNKATPVTPEAMAAALAPWMQAPASQPTHSGKLSDVNAALGGGLGPEPSSAHLIADQCGVMAKMRDTGGQLDQPTWYHSLGVLLHTAEAPDICHEWSKGDPRYDPAQVDANLERLGQFQPTTCAKLAEYQMDTCQACPHWGQITSPIQLGRPRMQRAVVETTETVVTKTGFTTQKAIKVDMPYGYGVETINGHKMLTCAVPADGDKPAANVVFCESFFRPLFNYEVEGIHYNDWVVDTRDGTQRTFTLEGGVIGSGRDKVAAELGRNGIMIVPGMGRMMDGYLNRWMTHLTRTSPLVKAYKSFGWTGEVFVTGGLALHPDGSSTPAVLAKPAKNREADVVCKGDLATWVSLVDRAYNAPGQEAFQFQLGCGFAAPLLSLMQQVNGVTVYSHTSGSGVGKTTVQKVALSAWGNPDTMMLSQNKVTHNALWGFLGAYNSLPIVYDELTNVKNDEVSELVFSVSSGRAKERMNAAGEIRTNNANWSTILMASGNSLLSDKLAQHRDNAAAEISRLFEFTLEVEPHLSVVEANALFPQFLDHYGHAGLAFARYVATHRDKVSDLLRTMQKRVVAEFRMEQVDRHWSALFAAVLVALYLCRGLKLLAFEVDPIKAWMAGRLGENREQKADLILTDEEKLTQLLADMWPNVLVTTGQGAPRRGVAAHVDMDKPPQREAMVGRKINPSGSDPEQLYLSRTAIREWANRKHMNYKELFAAAVALQWIDPLDDHRFDLGVGTTGFTNNTYTRCWKFRPANMPAYVAAPDPATNVVSLNTRAPRP